MKLNWFKNFSNLIGISIGLIRRAFGYRMMANENQDYMKGRELDIAAMQGLNDDTARASVY